MCIQENYGYKRKLCIYNKTIYVYDIFFYIYLCIQNETLYMFFQVLFHHSLL